MLIKESKQAGYFIVIEPTAEATKMAAQLAKNNWAAVLSNGSLKVHNSRKAAFVAMMSQPEQSEGIAPAWKDDLDSWLWANLPSGICRHILEGGVHPAVWNEKWAGRTVSEIRRGFDLYA